MLLNLLNTIAAVVNITSGCVVVFIFIKLRKYIQRINMNAEELLQNIDIPYMPDTQIDVKRERLSAIIAGGSSTQYLGHQYQLTDLDSMSTEKVNQLYCRYEARLGASMTKTLGNSFSNLYVMGVSKYFNVIDPPKLICDLEEDPFVKHALTSACCELYYKYGMYLAPFTAMLTTVRHVDFKNNKNTTNKNGIGDTASGGADSEGI